MRTNAPDEDDDLPLPSLPPVRLAPLPQLAAAARASELLAEAVRLAEWLRPQTKVTPEGVLHPADAVAAAGELRLISYELAPGAVRSARDLPELDRLWRLALAAGLIETGRGSARPGPRCHAYAAGDDEEIVALWADALGGLLGDQEAASPDEILSPAAAVDRELPGLLVAIYAADEPVSVDALLDDMVEHVLRSVGLDDDYAAVWAEAAGAALTHAVENLARLGAVTGDTEKISLTPLGTWGMRRLLIAQGYRAPVIGALARASAAELLAGLAGYDAEPGEEEIAAWLARRTPQEAARDLVATAATGTPAIRSAAFAILDRLGSEAAPVVRDGLADPQTRPYSRVWLREHGQPDCDELTPQDQEWLLVDLGASLLAGDDPAAVARELLPPGTTAEQVRILADLWRVDHPEVATVLTAISDHHPDPVVAKAARKSALRARTRQAS